MWVGAWVGSNRRGSIRHTQQINWHRVSIPTQQRIQRLSFLTWRCCRATCVVAVTVVAVAIVANSNIGPGIRHVHVKTHNGSQPRRRKNKNEINGSNASRQSNAFPTYVWHHSYMYLRLTGMTKGARPRTSDVRNSTPSI